MDARVSAVGQQVLASQMQVQNQNANSQPQQTSETVEVAPVQTPKISMKQFVMSEEDIRALLLLVVRGTNLNEIRQRLAHNLKNAG